MRLYSENDLRDYRYLSSKYDEITDKIAKQEEGRSSVDVLNTIECKYHLKLIMATKEMMDPLGVEVPDDKAKELGFDGV